MSFTEPKKYLNSENAVLLIRAALFDYALFAEQIENSTENNDTAGDLSHCNAFAVRTGLFYTVAVKIQYREILGEIALI